MILGMTTKTVGLIAFGIQVLSVLYVFSCFKIFDKEPNLFVVYGASAISIFLVAICLRVDSIAAV